MSSTAYHWSPRLVESGEGVETVDPWLDDKTTIPYRRGAARSSMPPASTTSAIDTQPEAASPPQRATTLPPRPIRPTLPATYTSSTRALPAPAAAAASTRSARPYFSPPAVLNPPKASVIPLQRAAAATANATFTGQHRRQAPTMKVARPVQPRKRQPTTMKIERLPTPAALTPDQVAHDALESYWRMQEPAVRGRNTRLYIGAAIGAALLVAVALRLFAPELLPSLPWQRAPSVNLADLMTREHATAQRAAAAGDAQTSKVLVTAPGADSLVQPATLRIDSQPWARVFVDDVLIGNTPQLAIKLLPGKHNVRLQNPEHRVRRDIPLEVRPGETVHRVEQLIP